MMNDVYCIVGMHRSGTSAVAKALHLGGISMGFDLLGPNPGNVFGHFEDNEFLALHTRLLDRYYQRFRPEDPNSNIFFEQLVKVEFCDADLELIRSAIKKRQSLGRWGWKDPRTSIFLNCWLNVIPNLKIIILFRHPLAVVDSLVRRGNSEVLIGIDFLVDNWLFYYASIISALSTRGNDCIVIESGDVLNRSSDFAYRLAKFCGLRESGIRESISKADHPRNINLDSLSSGFRKLRPDVSNLFDMLKEQSQQEGACFREGFGKHSIAPSLNREFCSLFGYNPALHCYVRHFSQRKRSGIRNLKRFFLK